MLLITSTSDMGMDDFRQKVVRTENPDVNFITDQPISINELMDLFKYSSERHKVKSYEVKYADSIMPNYIETPNAIKVRVNTESGHKINFLIQHLSSINEFAETVNDPLF